MKKLQSSNPVIKFHQIIDNSTKFNNGLKKIKKSIYYIGGLFFCFLIVLFVFKAVWKKINAEILIKNEVQKYVIEKLDKLDYPYTSINFTKLEACVSWGSFGGIKIPNCYNYEFDINLEDGNQNKIKIEYSMNKPEKMIWLKEAVEAYKINSTAIKEYFNYEYEKITQYLGRSVMEVKMSGNFLDYLDMAFLDNLDTLSNKICKSADYEIEIIFKDNYKVRISNSYFKSFEIYNSKGYSKEYYFKNNVENLKKIKEWLAI